MAPFITAVRTTYAFQFLGCEATLAVEQDFTAWLVITTDECTSHDDDTYVKISRRYGFVNQTKVDAFLKNLESVNHTRQ